MKIWHPARLFNVRVRRRSVAGVLAVLLLAGCGVPSREDIGFPVLGYYAWWMAPHDAEIDLTYIDTLFFFDLSIDSTGAVIYDRGWPEAWQPLITRARATGTRIVPVVTLPDEASFVALFQNPEAVARLRSTLVALALDPASDGLHIDFEVFEQVPAGVAERFVEVVREVRADLVRSGAHVMRPYGAAGLSIFLPAFDYAGVFDEVALAAAVDYVVVQGYDIHWREAPRAGPIAPLRGWEGQNWEAILARYDALGISRNKLFFSVPYYGFEWPTETDLPAAATRGPAQLVTYAPFDSLMPPDFAVPATHRIRESGHRRDSLSGVPYYTYEAADGWYQGWFEDEESLRQKYTFIRSNRLAGAALFALGYDRGRMEPALWKR